MTLTQNINGYLSDIPYLRDFKPMLAPAWLDHVALIAGVTPPRRESGFAWCDLGCGQGVTAAILAATHPAGTFFGIDAMARHIDHARRLSAEAAVSNAAFRIADFTDALDLELPQFDYIVAHGVYTWIDAAGREALRRFIDHRLKPGGLVYIGYNTMPGWARDLPFQRLVRELSLVHSGDSATRVAAATATIRALAQSGVPALAASYLVDELERRPGDYPPAYLVHELMPAAWQPLYVTELRAAMATIGLIPVGSATLSENFDWMVLSKSARKTLDTISEPDTRELVRDFFLDQRFRCDVFTRENQWLDADERTERLLSSSFALARPAAAIRFATTTPAGPFFYRSAAARAIVAALADGPTSLSRLRQSLIDERDLRALLSLCAAGDIMPVAGGRFSVDKINKALYARIDSEEAIGWLSLPCGTAIAAEADLLRRLRDHQPIGETQFPGWRSFLASHGL